MTVCGRLFKSLTNERPKACVAIKSIDARLILHLCFRNVVAVKIEVGDGLERKMVCSAHFPHEREGPLLGSVIRLVEYCQEKAASRDSRV